ncbi:MAG TPA: dienelactone hydrolase family protein [Candidatus Acidoferrales bacterium]|nr:dienelactone hydrolase family protein [Candidatus Acidoferrales bacterium]
MKAFQAGAGDLTRGVRDRGLTARGVEHDIRIYGGAKHSFFNDTLPAYDPAAAKDAWERTLRFLDRHVARRA